MRLSEWFRGPKEKVKLGFGGWVGLAILSLPVTLVLFIFVSIPIIIIKKDLTDKQLGVYFLIVYLLTIFVLRGDFKFFLLKNRGKVEKIAAGHANYYRDDYSRNEKIRMAREQLKIDQIAIKDRREEKFESAQVSKKELLIRALDRFKPSNKWKIEEGYHGELQGWLKTQFPQARVEERDGGSRADIFVDGVAIEVKGPTRMKDLDSIYGKCARYPHHFKNGLIVVLFDLKVRQENYSEWLNTVKKHFPDVTIIKK